MAIDRTTSRSPSGEEKTRSARPRLDSAAGHLGAGLAQSELLQRAFGNQMVGQLLGNGAPEAEHAEHANRADEVGAIVRRADSVAAVAGHNDAPTIQLARTKQSGQKKKRKPAARKTQAKGKGRGKKEETGRNSTPTQALESVVELQETSEVLAPEEGPTEGTAPPIPSITLTSPEGETSSLLEPQEPESGEATEVPEPQTGEETVETESAPEEEPALEEEPEVEAEAPAEPEFDIDAIKADLQRAREGVARIRKHDKNGAISADTVNERLRVATDLQKDEKWAELQDRARELNDEVALLESYVEAKQSSQKRIMDLKKASHKEKVALVTGPLQAFISAVGRSPRNDAAIVTLLETLHAAIQVHLDKEAADQAQANADAALRADGLWPANNNRAAIITERARAAVGAAGEERTAVVEALDALKNPQPNDWGTHAFKWGVPHGNGEGNLPGVRGGGGYLEYYVRAAGSWYRPSDGKAMPPGARRLVKHIASGRVYYSPNHYGQPNGTTLPAFYKISDP